MTKISKENEIRIDALTTAGLKPKAISVQLELNYNTVKQHIRRKKLVAGLPPRFRIRETYFKGRIPGLIRRYVEENPLARVDDILYACELTCHRTTLNRYLNRNGLGRVKAKRNILLRDVNKIKRVEFCRDMLRKSDEELKRILWSDETMVKAFPNGEVVFYRAISKRDDIVSPAVQQGGSGQMLWGCMSFYSFGPLVVINGHIDGEQYLEMLQDTVKPEMDASRDLGRVLTFQQDNAKPHKARPVMEFLERWGYELLIWPPQSPDLSPIENIWNIMKMKMKARRPRPRTKATMRDAMLEIWGEIEDITRKNLIMTFRDRCSKCIRENGGLVRF
jgi:transposase